MDTHSTRAPAAHADTPNNSGGPTLTGLRINGCSPFWSNPDGVDERLAEAHAILTVLAAGFDADEECSTKCVESALTNIRAAIVAKALTGVATLIALAQYQQDLARHDRQARSDEGRA